MTNNSGLEQTQRLDKTSAPRVEPYKSQYYRLSGREIATVLAALRHFTRCNTQVGSDVGDTASGHGAFDALDIHDIDKLCSELITCQQMDVPEITNLTPSDEMIMFVEQLAHVNAGSSATPNIISNIAREARRLLSSERPPAHATAETKVIDEFIDDHIRTRADNQVLKAIEQFQCADCSKLFSEAELDEIDKPHLRCEPGDIMGDGQCPKCGAMCFRVPFEKTVEDTQALPAVTQLCNKDELTDVERSLVLRLVNAEYQSSLQKRRHYVIARKGNTALYTQLIADLTRDTEIFRGLANKLKK